MSLLTIWIFYLFSSLAHFVITLFVHLLICCTVQVPYVFWMCVHAQVTSVESDALQHYGL